MANDSRGDETGLMPMRRQVRTRRGTSDPEPSDHPASHPPAIR